MSKPRRRVWRVQLSSQEPNDGNKRSEVVKSYGSNVVAPNVKEACAKAAADFASVGARVGHDGNFISSIELVTEIDR